MEQSLGKDPVPDKSRVLDVKPIRRLVPIFPSPPNGPSFSTPQGSAPFVCVPPSGPFPHGSTPFYPFFASPESQRAPEQSTQTPFGAPNQTGAPFSFNSPISDAVPITSFRTPAPTTGAMPEQNGVSGSSTRSSSRGQSRARSGVAEEDGTRDVEKKKKTRSEKKTKGGKDINFASPDTETDAMVNNILASFNLTEFDPFRRADGDRESVGYVLMIFDMLRRRITQTEESKDATPGITRRPDLKAGTLLMNKGVRTNVKKRIGVVPGVEVGDIFIFRMELCVVGLHAPSMAGIDYMSIKITQEEEPVAVSIVSSGGYEDNVEDGDVLIYSGQGGNMNRKDKEVSDQKLERGNLALENSLHRGNEVRVIRGVKDIANSSGKIYLYDGLYRIQESWVEKGKSGCNVFKYKLVRLPGQPEAFKMWKSIQHWREGIASRVGVILPDLTSGAENLPVSLVNDVDDEKGPAYFTYLPSLAYSKPVSSLESSVSCTCIGGCQPGNINCPCIKKNGGYLPYNANGVLVNQMPLIYECGPSCMCHPNCRNRVSQGGLKVRLEVFKTKDKGWGLRSWDPIRAGAFICEYAGEVINSSEVEDLGGEYEDDYIFNATRTYHPKELLPGDSNEAPRLPFPLIITANNCGNVARFMNHSCYPNVFWQPVLRENNNKCDLHIAFHATKHIPPMTELTYDYGIAQPGKVDQRRKKCLCGALKCRGYFY